jgi:nucleoside-diphosphate-sugar epimerase
MPGVVRKAPAGRCLVTGGTGFVGQRLVRTLVDRGHRVRVLTRRAPAVRAEALASGIEFVHGDIRDPERVRDALADVEVVFHVAGEKRKTDAVASVNVDGTRNLLDRCVEAGITRVVHVSSAGVTGRPRGRLVTEDTPCAPDNAYEQAKDLAEHVVEEFRARHGVRITIVRPTNVFGDGDPEQHLSTLIDIVARGRFRFIGNESAMVNYVYVDDVADACSRLYADAASGATYIVSDPCSLGDFVGAIADALAVPRPSGRVPAWLAEGAGLVADVAARVTARRLPLTAAKVKAARSPVVYSSLKLRAALDSWPPCGWAEGVRRTVAWYQRSRV